MLEYAMTRRARAQQRNHRIWSLHFEPTEHFRRLMWRIWAIYHEHKLEGIPPPSVRQLQQDVGGYRSHTQCYLAVKMLEKWGVLENTPGRSRARQLKIPFQQWLGD